MKKIIFSLICILFMTTKSFAADYYTVGVDAFKKGAYDKASSNLNHAIKINPKHVNARYYLAQVYLKQNQFGAAVDQYNRIIFLNPDSSAGILAQKGLSLINSASSGGTIAKYSDLDKYKDNYFDYVLTPSGQIAKWQKFPINVYIEPKTQLTAAKKAFEQWQVQSNNLASFNYVNSPQNAQVAVLFKSQLESTSTNDKFFAGFSKPIFDGKYLTKSEINILTTNPQTGQAFDNNFIYATTLHELGHSLGFTGHSPSSNDVMAAFSTDPKMALTTRDINTLNLVYRMDSNALASRTSGSFSIKLRQAQEYVKNSPDKFVGWSNLGDIYLSKKMYSNAINNYKKAISIEPDRASLHNSLGVSYKMSGDKQNAYLSFKRAYQLEPENELYKKQFAQICQELGRKAE